MAQELQTFVVLGGRIDNSFTQIGEKLMNLGSQVSQISRQLIDFGKSSLNVYKAYEDSMLEARGAMGGVYKDATTLDRVMNDLESAAQGWAANSIFHTNDVASAIAEAAHAGMTYEEIMATMPAAMRAAQAGGLDLSTALDVVIKGIKSTGRTFEESERFVDLWVYSANRSATTIGDMGDEIVRLSAAGRLTDSMEEMFTMMAVLADNGLSAEQGGTMLRNMMIRLVAPTKKAAEAMAELAEYGIDYEELEKAGADIEKLNAVAAGLKETGFSVYDAAGNLKPMLTIFRDLSGVLGGMSEEKYNSIVATLFPTRTFVGANAMLNAARENYDGLYHDLVTNSAGVGQRVADTMMSGYTGATELAKSKVEEMQRAVGGVLAEQVESWTVPFNALIDSINGMDDAAFRGVIGGLEALAFAGPGLLIAGKALRLIGTMVGSPWAAAALGIGVMTAGLASYMNAVREANFAGEFGDLSLDNETVHNYIKKLGDGFSSASTGVQAYADAMESAVSQYTIASTTLKSDLLTTMLTGATLTNADITQLQGLGGQMYDQMLAGIEQARGRSMEGVAALFGEDYVPGEEIQSPVLAGIIFAMNYGYEQAIASAQDLSQQLRDAMTSAFDDGKLTADEISNIQSVIDQMNQLLAEQTDKADYVQRQTMLHKAQTIGFDSFSELAEEARQGREAIYADLISEQAGQYWDAQRGYAMMVENGLIEQTEADAQLKALEDAQALKRSQFVSGTNDFIMDLFNEMMRESDLAEEYAGITGYGRRLMGAASADAAQAIAAQASYSGLGTGNMDRAIDALVTTLGGWDNMPEQISEAVATGQSEYAQQLSEIYAAGMVSTRFMSDINGADAYIGANKYMGTPVQEISVQAHESHVQQAMMDAQSVVGGTPLEAKVSVANAMEAAQEALGTMQGVLADINAIVHVRVNTGTGWSGTSYGGSGSGAGGGGAVGLYENAFGLKNKYAEGGRATVASIFGEAGPEWAIPEEHSARTAELLDLARQASGFSWPELLRMNGGLNAGGGANRTLVYSPTIYAQDASDVESKLRADKDRLEAWLDERALRDEIEVYR